MSFSSSTTSFHDSRRIIVTGGTGLLGSALHSVITDENVLYMNSSLCDLTNADQTAAIFKLLQPTHVIHLAARVGGLFDNMKNNLEFFEQNVKINMNVLHQCSLSPTVVKVVSCLSTCIFPDGIEMPLTIDKLHKGLPHSSNIGYSFAKRMIDVENRILHTEEKPFIGVIPTNMFGPNDNFDLEKSHVIPALIHKCYLAKRDSTPLYIRGSGKAKRQFLYSKDAAELIVRLMDSYSGVEPVILAPSEEYTISEVAQKIADIFKFDGKIVYETTEGDIENDGNAENDGQNRKYADNSAITLLFPDFTFTPFEDALRETIHWFVKKQNVDMKSK